VAGIVRDVFRESLLALLACLFFIQTGAAQIPTPPLKQRVTDLSGVLTHEERSAIENKLQAFEQKKGPQIAVLIIPSLEGEDISAFGIRVAESWKLGRKGIDDGAILIVSMKDRRMRIEVGYGLEGVLNDAVSKRIISDIITPFFKAGDYFHGINNGVKAMIKVIEGEPLPAVEKKPVRKNIGADTVVPVLVFFLFISQFFAMIFGRLASSILISFLTFVALLAFGLSFFWSFILALAAFILTIFTRTLPADLPERGYRGRSVWGTGRGGFGGGISTSRGGGGFSGGGGSFGGGGASGGW